jgi:POT family
MYMDLRMGPTAHITSATLNLFDTLAIILLVPLYDLLLVPMLAKRGIRISYLQRIGWGLVVRSPTSPLTPPPPGGIIKIDRKWVFSIFLVSGGPE